MKHGTDIDFLRTHDLTVEEILLCPTFKHLSEAEAKSVIEALKIFTKITYDFYKKSAETLPNTGGVS